MCSACHILAPTPNCLRLLSHLTVLACMRALVKLGRRMAIRSEMIPMTTSNSTSVNARRICFDMGVPFRASFLLTLEFELVKLIERSFHPGNRVADAGDRLGARLVGPFGIKVAELQADAVLNRKECSAAD